MYQRVGIQYLNCVAYSVVTDHNVWVSKFCQTTLEALVSSQVYFLMIYKRDRDNNHNKELQCRFPIFVFFNSYMY